MKNILFLGVIVLSSCIADLRTKGIKKNTQTKQQMEYAQQLLQQAMTYHGVDKMLQYKTYEAVCVDHWKGPLGKMGKLWKWNKDKMVLRFHVGDFDSQVEVLEGKHKGKIAGVQSWEYYEKKEGKYSRDVKEEKRVVFGLTAYHYFFEILPRLKNAPIIRYAGQDELRGEEMEKVFVSWGTDNTKKYDQYIIWIAKKTGKVEALTYTIRDNYLPMSGSLYASLQFDDYREVEGVIIPFRQTVQINQPKKSKKKYIHQLQVQEFSWDSFPLKDIQPFDDLKPVGDSKVTR